MYQCVCVMANGSNVAGWHLCQYVDNENNVSVIKWRIVCGIINVAIMAISISIWHINE